MNNSSMDAYISIVESKESWITMSISHNDIC